jgi:TPR repeat protein
VEHLRWLRLSAAQNFAEAQNALAVAYSSGEFVMKDHIEAAHLFHLAAEQGRPDAQYNLGLCYQIGDGVAKDTNEAIRWFRKSADQGYSVAQSVLEQERMAAALNSLGLAFNRYDDPYM